MSVGWIFCIEGKSKMTKYCYKKSPGCTRPLADSWKYTLFQWKFAFDLFLFFATLSVGWNVWGRKHQYFSNYCWIGGWRGGQYVLVDMRHHCLCIGWDPYPAQQGSHMLKIRMYHMRNYYMPVRSDKNMVRWNAFLWLWLWWPSWTKMHGNNMYTQFIKDAPKSAVVRTQWHCINASLWQSRTKFFIPFLSRWCITVPSCSYNCADLGVAYAF